MDNELSISDEQKDSVSISDWVELREIGERVCDGGLKF